MSSISLFLRTVNDSVNVFKMNQPYSEPKIFTGGVNINQWKNLSKAEQNKALSKDWFVYYSFRDPKSGKLKRQPHIKAGANRHKNKRTRLSILKTFQRNLLLLLEHGFNPYKDNSKLKAEFYGETSNEKDAKGVESVPLKSIQVETVVAEKNTTPSVTVAEAFETGLLIKKNELTDNSYRGYVSHVNRFNTWLKKKKLHKASIREINKRIVIEYLNEVLKNSSARNRNNVRASLSSLFKTLENNEIIADNFIAKINVLKSKPTRNKTYTPAQLEKVYAYMQKHDPVLMLFVNFISYNYLRPIEVCRLKIKDIDILDKKLYVKAKNKALKTKIIPQILIDLLPDLSQMDKDYFLFTPEIIGGVWDTKEVNKRDHFSKRFKIVKDHFGLGSEYGLYSFRHTFITKLYRQFRKELTQYEAKSKLMLITGHTTMTALEQYLRDIDAELPEDYSNLLH